MIAKWIQIAAPVVFAIISAAVLLRDWKCYDKRTIAYRRFTAIMIVVWIVAALTLGWSTWKTFPQPEPRPAFSFYLNGKPIQNGAPLTLVVTNREPVLVLSVKNHGAAPAERLTVHAVAPAGFFRSNAGWSGQSAGFDTQDGELRPRSGMIDYQIEAAGLIDPTCFFVCPPLAASDGLRLPCTFGFAMVATAKGGPRDAAWLMISLVQDSKNLTKNR